MNLPPLPQTPTDNLYKFMSIFGLTLLIVGTVAPAYVQHNEAIYRAEVMAKVRTIDTEMIISGTLPAVKDMFEKGQVPTEPGEARDKFNDFLVKNGQTIDELNKLVARNSYTDFVMITSVIINLLGVLLIIWGFSLWYRRLQIYQDIIVKNQAKQSMKELVKSTNTEQGSK